VTGIGWRGNDGFLLSLHRLFSLVMLDTGQETAGFPSEMPVKKE